MRIKIFLCYIAGHKYTIFRIPEVLKIGGKGGVTQKKLDKMGYFECKRCGDKLYRNEPIFHTYE